MSEKFSAFINSPTAVFRGKKVASVPGVSQIFKSAGADFAEKGKRYLSHIAVSKAQDALKDCMEGVVLPNNNTIGSIINGKTSMLGKNNFSVSYHSRTTSSSIGLGEVSSKMYTTTFEVGIPITNRLKKPLETKVRTTKSIRDSERDYIHPRLREYLTTSFGFNQRSYDFLKSHTYLMVKDMRFMYKDRYATYGKGIDSDLYGDFLQERLRLCVKSETQHYSLQCKIHVVKIINTKSNLHQVVENTFYKGIETDSGSFLKAIPVDHQFSEPNDYGDFRYNILTDLDCTLNLSNYFRRNCEIVKTFSRVLGPNDIWNFDYKLNYGAGVYLNDLYQDQNQFLPLGYTLVIDCQGDPRASITRRDDGANFDGSSPGRFDYRFNHEITFLKEQDSMSSDQSEKLTVTKFPSKSDSFESSRLGTYFSSGIDERPDKINVDFGEVDVNLIADANSSQVPFKLRYSESRLVTYNSNYSNPLDQVINLDPPELPEDERKIIDEEIDALINEDDEIIDFDEEV